MPALVIVVQGIPRPQGSKIPMRSRSTGKCICKESSKGLDEWRALVAAAAIQARANAGWATVRQPCSVRAEFRFLRPKSHFVHGLRGRDRQSCALRDSAPRHHTNTRDVDKLARAAFDALVMGGVAEDDRYFHHLYAAKRWCRLESEQGATLWVEAN